MATATVAIERSGPAIRSALAEHSPEELVEFESEFGEALARAGTTFDLRPVEALLDRWWGAAVAAANPLSEHEQGLVARARAGDDTGWLARNDDGTWTRM